MRHEIYRLKNSYGYYTGFRLEILDENNNFVKAYEAKAYEDLSKVLEELREEERQLQTAGLTQEDLKRLIYR